MNDNKTAFSFIIDILNYLKVENIETLDYDNIYFETKTNYYCICSPHEGTNYKWLFRKNKKKNFDKWSNSDEERLYENISDLFSRIFKIRRF